MINFKSKPAPKRIPVDSHNFPQQALQKSSGKQKVAPAVSRLSALFGATFLLGAVTLLLVVTGADPESSSQDTPSQVAKINQLVAASLERESVTRAPPNDLMSPMISDQTSYTPSLPDSNADDQIQIASVAVSKEAPTLAAAPPAPALHLDTLTGAILSGAYSVETREFNGRLQLALRPENTTISREELRAFLQAAEQRGETFAPNGSTFADNDVDLEMALFNLIQGKLIKDSTPRRIEAAREMTNRAFHAISQNGTEVIE